MDAKRLRELLRYVVSEVKDLDGNVSTIRLVKLLYIIDLECYRRFGKILTGFNWIFYLYGPYAFELPSLLQSAGLRFDAKEFIDKEGHRGTSFHVPYTQETPEWLSFTYDQIIKGLVGVWYGQDTDELLRYVYDTEPVRLGERGLPIDFTKASRGSRYVEIYIPPLPVEFVQRVKDSITNYKQTDSRRFTTFNCEYNPILKEGLAALDEDDACLPAIGRTSISFDSGSFQLLEESDE